MANWLNQSRHLKRLAPMGCNVAVSRFYDRARPGIDRGTTPVDHPLYVRVTDCAGAFHLGVGIEPSVRTAPTSDVFDF